MRFDRKRVEFVHEICLCTASWFICAYQHVTDSTAQKTAPSVNMIDVSSSQFLAYCEQSYGLIYFGVEILTFFQVCRAV